MSTVTLNPDGSHTLTIYATKEATSALVREQMTKILRDMLADGPDSEPEDDEGETYETWRERAAKVSAKDASEKAQAECSKRFG